MDFLGTKVFFLWLLAAGLPLLVYWLYRQRKSVVEWSANYILRQALRQTSRRNLWRQFVILALRMLVLALLVLALAQPFVHRKTEPGSLPHGEGSLHQIVLVDNSRSMSISYHSITRAEEMYNRLEPLLKRLRYGDHCELIPLAVPTAGKLAALPVPCPASPARTKAILEQLELLERPAALEDGLQLAVERFELTRSRHRQLILLSDLSGKDLPATKNLLNFKRVLQKQNVRVAAYEIADKERPNLSVEGLEAGAAVMYAGWRYHIYIAVRNYSRQPVASSLTVQIRQDGKNLSRPVGMPLDLKANERKRFDFPITMPAAAGLVTVRASVQDEAYRFDNAREFNIQVKPTARILLVRHPGEDDITNSLWRDSYYFESALRALQRPGLPAKTGPVKSGWSFVRDPKTGKMRQVQNLPGPASEAARRPNLKLDLQRLTADELTAKAIRQADAIVFFGVSSVGPELVVTLRRFLEQGGGVLFGLGDTVYPAQFNQTFRAISPARLLRRYVRTRRERRDWDYNANHKRIEKTFDHPILRHYLSESEGPVENVRVYNYFRVTGEAGELMTLSNSDPLLLERRFGRGKVMLYTSTLGGAWNTLPARNQYSNFVYAWLTYLCSFRELNRNLAPGDSLIMPAATPELSIGLPENAGTLGPLARKLVNGQAFYRFDDLSQPGEYALLGAGDKLGRIQVQGTFPESDTLGLDQKARRELSSNLGCFITADWPALAQGLAVDERQGWRAAGAFILALMLCLLLDAILTRVWFR